ncbi:MAG: hypothetical protein ACOVMM_08595 [Chitinophagaceae bacterium]
MKKIVAILLLFFGKNANSQDTTLKVNERVVTLPEVLVKNNFDYNSLLNQIKEDTTFYKAFRNLKVLNYSAYNNIQMLDKKNKLKASMYSKTKQVRNNGCRSMQVLEEKVTGDFYNNKKEFNYQTAEMYASLFFAKGTVCGENNIVAGKSFSTSNKKGIEKHKEQLKMLFFNPGRKIPGIPFIGNKIDLYDDNAKLKYDYKIDVVEFNGKLAYLFEIKPKETLSDDEASDIVIDEMTTWFDKQTMEVLARNYTLSYKAGVYDFDVRMEVTMQKVKGLLVPQVLRYRGNWDVIFKKRENAIFTATIFDVE